jgi:5-methyltetrahydrofolate--homocysteine methyltransferase
VDVIGLSGLITPSLDEMAHVAREMERTGSPAAADRRRHHQQNAHGGAHRPGYSGTGGACAGRLRAVPVVASLLSPQQRDGLWSPPEERTGPGAARGLSGSELADPLAEARARAPGSTSIGTPRRSSWVAGRSLDRQEGCATTEPGGGRRRRAEWRRVGWKSWCRVHRLVAVLSHLGIARGVSRRSWSTPKHGEQARQLFADARKLLGTIVVAGTWLEARGVYGFFPANSVGRRYRDVRR